METWNGIRVAVMMNAVEKANSKSFGWKVVLLDCGWGGINFWYRLKSLADYIILTFD
jgi:hypothetical protein